jgi:hypothetical protein
MLLLVGQQEDSAKYIHPSEPFVWFYLAHFMGAMSVMNSVI